MQNGKIILYPVKRKRKNQVQNQPRKQNKGGCRTGSD
jgi:hypothetical protein